MLAQGYGPAADWLPETCDWSRPHHAMSRDRIGQTPAPLTAVTLVFTCANDRKREMLAVLVGVGSQELHP